MQIAIHPMDFSWPGGPAEIRTIFGRVLERAEAAGVHSVWPMDHVFQIGIVGEPHQPMLEAYATLAWAAGRTERIQLGALVTGTPYRHPGLLIKAVTTLDVLSGGRAWLGLGAAWNGEEAAGLGLPFPPLAERFERLEEVLQIAHQMFEGDDRPYRGRHYQLERPLNVPEPVRRPPILIGGGGERKTLRLVAQYADACNLFEQEVTRKLSVLREHCATVGRPADEIAVTTTGRLGTTDSAARAVDRFGQLADEGVDLAIIDVPEATDLSTFDFLAEVIEGVAKLGRPAPAVLNI
jgi:F420-dependent oxidoreductase-like protein